MPREEPMKSSVPWDEDTGGAFDIYADFNNAGPRYPGAQVLDTIGSSGKDGYRTINTPPPSTRGGVEPDAVEMVTVPRFGAEWTKEELRGMTKKGKAEDQKLARQQAWREWNQGRRGFFGKKWLTRKVIVWGTFIFIIVFILFLVLCLPRVPSFGWNPASPINAGTGDPTFTRGPEANFTFYANLDLEMSTGGNIIPIHMNNIHASIYLSDTNKLIASGDTGSFNQRGGTNRPLNVSVLFHYSANNDSDSTWNLVYNACKSATLYASGSRPGLNIVLVLDLFIRGLIGTNHASTSITNLACPIQLSTSSV
ncbi:hypothetical protein DL93DRAFT_839469 [Clavulina sp. PMI_390]|nr:hypothetical protein DL93DRAFT_839469 [Clavulina sp. PMI_390]